MGILDRLLGRTNQQPHQQPAGFGGQDARQPDAQQGVQQGGQPSDGQQQMSDEQAIERYEYLLRTAPPDQIEAAHEQAFAQLTPDQRRQVLQQLAEADPGQAPQDDSPKTLARSATRMEMQRPGAMRGMFGGGMGRGIGGMGMGAMIGGSLMGSIAGAFIGTAIAQEMFDGDGFGDSGGADEAGADPGTDAGDPGAADQGFAEDPGMDQGMDDGFGGADFGGDLGGGDFGGGDIGGF